MRSLITSTSYLSGEGVGRCWTEICNSFLPSVNPDIGGVGVSFPYDRDI